MYKQGVLLLCVSICLVLATNLALQNFAPDFLEEFTAIYNNYLNGDTTAFSAEAMANISQIDFVNNISYLLVAALLVIRVFSALFADSVYKTTVFEIIGKVKKQIDEGGMLVTPMPFSNSKNLSQEQLKRMYLSNKGGLSFFAPCLAIFAITLFL